jgi:uncharacterized membrane protein
MKSKALLFTGIFLLILGIVLRKMTPYENLGLVLIIIGVLCKTVYIISKARSGEYVPGKELIFLGVGLLLFLSGLYMRSLEQNLIDPTYMIVIGICLKLFFIIRFIQIVRSAKVSRQTLL